MYYLSKFVYYNFVFFKVKHAQKEKDFLIARKSWNGSYSKEHARKQNCNGIETFFNKKNILNYQS